MHHHTCATPTLDPPRAAYDVYAEVRDDLDVPESEPDGDDELEEVAERAIERGEAPPAKAAAQSAFAIGTGQFRGPPPSIIARSLSGGDRGRRSRPPVRCDRRIL
jgi:hypothetical protein